MNTNNKILNKLLARKAAFLVKKIIAWDKPFGIVTVKSRTLLALSKFVSDALNKLGFSCELVGIKDLSCVINKYDVIITVGVVNSFIDSFRLLEGSRSKVFVFVYSSIRDIPNDLRSHIVARVRLSIKECEMLAKKAQRIYTLNLIKLGANKNVARIITSHLMDLLISEKQECLDVLLRTWGLLIRAQKDLSENLLSVAEGLLNILAKFRGLTISLDSDGGITVRDFAISSGEALKVTYEFNGREYHLNLLILNSLEKLSEASKFVIFIHRGRTELAGAEILSTMGYLADKKNFALIYPVRENLAFILRCFKKVDENNPLLKVANMDLLQAFLLASVMADLGEKGIIPAEYVVSSCILYGIVLDTVASSASWLMWERRNGLLRRLISGVLSVEYSLAKKILYGVLSRIERTGLRVSGTPEKDLVAKWGDLVRDIAHEIKFRREMLA